MRANLDFLDELGSVSDDLRRINYLPSPDEIADACASIRQAWTLSEKRRRYVGETMPDEPVALWQPPIIDTAPFRVGASRNLEAMA